MLQCSLDVTEGLMHLHSNNILHLNLQSSSIVVCDGTAKINAFGIALRQAHRSNAPPEAQHLTPEADMFGLGCVLRELLSSGSTPLGGSTSAVDPEVKMLVQKLLHTNPSDRGPLTEVVQRLKALLNSDVQEIASPQPMFSMISCSLTPRWLDSVDEQPSQLLAALLYLVGCPLPYDRADLSTYFSGINEQTLRAWYQCAKDAVTSSFPQLSADSQEWRDECAMTLYKGGSPISHMINGMLAQPGAVPHALTNISPFTRRLFDAVRRRGRAFTREGFCVLNANTPFLQDAHTNYKKQFELGRSVHFHQFVTFTNDDSRAQQQGKLIVLTCTNLQGFVIDGNAQTDVGTALVAFRCSVPAQKIWLRRRCGRRVPIQRFRRFDIQSTRPRQPQVLLLQRLRRFVYNRTQAPYKCVSERPVSWMHRIQLPRNRHSVSPTR